MVACCAGAAIGARTVGGAGRVLVASDAEEEEWIAGIATGVAAIVSEVSVGGVVVPQHADLQSETSLSTLVGVSAAGRG